MSGGWSNTAVDEIILPNNTPFLPGNNVTGIGTQIPVELSAAGFTNAIVFYASDWNPTATTQSIKFRFIAANASGLQFGFGYCANPSISQTATVVTVETLSTFDSATGTNASVTFKNIAGNATYQFLDFGGAPSLFINDDDGVSVIKFNGLGNESSNIVLGTDPGSVTINHFKGSGNLQVTGPFIQDSAWNGVPFVNGWGAPDVNHPVQYRLMPDGTVMFRGHMVKTAIPTAGEAFCSALPTAYRPAMSVNFLCACNARAYNGKQKITINPDGTTNVWDFDAALSGDMDLSGVHYPTNAQLP